MGCCTWNKWARISGDSPIPFNSEINSLSFWSSDKLIVTVTWHVVWLNSDIGLAICSIFITSNTQLSIECSVNRSVSPGVRAFGCSISRGGTSIWWITLCNIGAGHSLVWNRIKVGILCRSWCASIVKCSSKNLTISERICQRTGIPVSGSFRFNLWLDLVCYSTLSRGNHHYWESKNCFHIEFVYFIFWHFQTSFII